MDYPSNGTTGDLSGCGGSSCWNRLPCGVCRMTNMMCPLWNKGPTITWTCEGGLTNPQTGASCTVNSGTSSQNIKATMNTEKE